MRNSVKYIKKLGIFLAIFVLALSIAWPNTPIAFSADMPEVATKGATNVGETAATLNAKIDRNGSSTRAWFEYGEDRNILYEVTSEDFVGSGVDDFYKNISGLNPGTTYYFRVGAENKGGIDYGSTLSFKTSGINRENTLPEPVATTISASSISSTSAQLNAQISTPTFNPVQAWFEWGTSTNLGNKTITTDIDPYGTSHGSVITGLTPGTKYYFRAVAENPDWRNGGLVLSFTTSAPVVKTPPSVIKESTPPPTQGAEVKPVEPTPTPEPTVEEKEKGLVNPEEAVLGASIVIVGVNVFGDGFLPDTILGWLLLIILILLFLLLGKYILYPRRIVINIP